MFARRFREFLALARDALAAALPARKAGLEPRLAALFSAALGLGFLGGLFLDFSAEKLGRPEPRAACVEFLLQTFFPA